MSVRAQVIAHQMMKGCNAKLYNRQKVAPDEAVETFKKHHQDIIAWVDANSPPRLNSGVLGVIGKAALWYGKERIKEFCDRLTKIEFKGEFDPCHVLWQYLLRLRSGAGRSTTDIYRRTVTVMRAFMEGRELRKITIRPSQEDLFEWDSTYTHMRRAKRNHGLGIVWEERCALADKALGAKIKMTAEVEEAIQYLKDSER